MAPGAWVVTTSSWDRKLWAVRFAAPDGTVFLVGEAWDANRRGWELLDGEPTRALLFTTRRAARAWASARRKKYPAPEAGWRFTAVRVRETVAEL